MAFIGTTAPLGANGTWTSQTVNTGLADNLTGLVWASHAGSLVIEQSADGTNWDFGRTIAVAATTGQTFTEPIMAPYIRLRYTNGATAQTGFRLASRFSSAGSR